MGSNRRQYDKQFKIEAVRFGNTILCVRMEGTTS